MLRMRLCAALALSVAGTLALAPGANATTYCNDPSTAGVPECTQVFSPQQALNMAAAHPGFDTVVLGAATYDVGAGLVYSDGGDASNGVRIESRTHCPDRYGCDSSTLSGGAPGTAALRLSAPGGADVSVVSVAIQSGEGATGLALGPGTRARGVNVSSWRGPGVSLEGTEARPAVLDEFPSASGAPAVDAPGYGMVENALLHGPVGARADDGGFLDIRGGAVNAFAGVTGPRVRVTGTAIAFGESYDGAIGSPVGVDVACPGAGSPDASADITNATMVGKQESGSTGIRAKGAGGDGESCDATVRVSSTIVHRPEVSLEANGESGSGTDPRDGNALIEASYSDFRAVATRVTGPAEIESSSPGYNVDTDPGLYSDLAWGGFPLLWSSPMIDAGDPATPEEWQRPYIEVVHGRRDIGGTEYGFHRPKVEPSVYPGPVATGTRVSLNAYARDDDPGDPLEVEWTLPDRSTVHSDGLVRRFYASRRYRFHVKATDPTGQVAEADATVRVVEQRISDLRVRPARFRADRLRDGRGGAQILFDAAGYGNVRFTVQRAVRRSGSSRIRWRRVPGRFDFNAWAFEALRENSVAFKRWFGVRRPRPGLYRLIATPLSDGTGARTRFRILR